VVLPWNQPRKHLVWWLPRSCVIGAPCVPQALAVAGGWRARRANDPDETVIGDRFTHLVVAP
jgi:hypothetical protein